MSELRCERCGATFGCGVESGSCWCAQVELDDDARAELAARYESCLCPACLGQPPAGSEPRTLRSGLTSALGSG